MRPVRRAEPLSARSMAWSTAVGDRPGRAAISLLVRAVDRAELAVAVYSEPQGLVLQLRSLALGALASRWKARAAGPPG